MSEKLKSFKRQFDAEVFDKDTQKEEICNQIDAILDLQKKENNL